MYFQNNSVNSFFTSPFQVNTVHVSCCSFLVYCGFIDVRELVELEDVMEAEDLKLGPNGGLVFCME